MLRDAVAGLVPDEVRLRPKQPFQVPPISALCSKHRWKNYVEWLTESHGGEVVDNTKLRNFMLELKTKSVEEQAVDEPVWMIIASYKTLVSSLFGNGSSLMEEEKKRN